jgi:isopentenyl diphosphate isomerase/L-lactate dehydrogenase-like FMN-dependent dehydrogenase
MLADLDLAMALSGNRTVDDLTVESLARRP